MASMLDRTAGVSKEQEDSRTRCGPSKVQPLCVVICRPLSTYLFFVISFVMKRNARMVITSEIRVS